MQVWIDLARDPIAHKTVCSVLRWLLLAALNTSQDMGRLPRFSWTTFNFRLVETMYIGQDCFQLLGIPLISPAVAAWLGTPTLHIDCARPVSSVAALNIATSYLNLTAFSFASQFSIVRFQVKSQLEQRYAILEASSSAIDPSNDMADYSPNSRLGTGLASASYRPLPRASPGENTQAVNIASEDQSPELPHITANDSAPPPGWKFSIRAIFTILGSFVYTGLYAAIVFVYLQRRGTNGIVKHYVVDARIVTYLWFVASVFVLDWARIGLTGFEAAGLTSRLFAPRTALNFMWHADKSWSMLTGWLNVARSATILFARKHNDSTGAKQRHHPGLLWWVLALINLPLWIAVPLSGPSFNLGRTLSLSGEEVLIDGVNSTTFDMRSSTLLWQSATSRWPLGMPTVPKQPNIYYAPHGTKNVSETFYNDTVETYQDEERITVFVGPDVNQRVDGKAWGLEVSVSCKIVNPYKDLALVDVKALGSYEKTGAAAVGYLTGGPIYGCSNAVLAVSNSTYEQTAAYPYLSTNVTEGQPVFHQGLLEIVVWQYYNESLNVDPTMQEMRKDLAVVAEPLPGSFGPLPNPDILAYGLSLSINSSVGSALLSAEQRTYSDFRWEPSSPLLTNPSYGIVSDPNYNASACSSDGSTFTKYCNKTAALEQQNQQQIALMSLLIIAGFIEDGGGVMVLENLILASLTCLKPSSSVLRIPCLDSWNVANLATGGKPYATGNPPIVQSPAISPQRMRRAILKLVGEMALAMMGPGPEPFVGQLTGVKPTYDLVPGVISWKIELALLILWALLITISVGFFIIKRGSIAPLEGYQMFKFGAEWSDEMRDCAHGDFRHCQELATMPGAEELAKGSKDGRYGFMGATLRRRRERTKAET
jgi:hypothetical protein